MWPSPQSPADLVTFTDAILKEKFQFLCSAPFPCSPVIRECFVKENPDRKKNESSHFSYKAPSYLDLI